MNARGVGLSNRYPVARSADFNRVVALPVRTDAAYPSNLIPELSRLCATPAGLAAGVQLRDVQAKALYDLGTYKQGFFPMRVGSGKTLVTFLGPRMVGAKRPLLLTKAALLQKTDREWRKEGINWKVSQQIQMRSYEFLGRVSGAEWIDRYKPDAIFADECQFLKNRRAAVTRRVERYIKANPTTIFVPMTGTMMKKSIKDFAHLLEWSHGVSSVLPLRADALLEWAEALDEGMNMFQQRQPGCLLELFPSSPTPVDDDENKTARRVFQKRLEATAGVVISDTTDDFTGSLLIEALEYTPNATTDANFKILRDDMCRPDGWALTEAMQVWAVARQLALGLHYFWEPSPPQAWMDARKQWAQFVRDTLGHPSSARAGLDSELQVANAVLRGDLEDEYGVLAQWQKIKPTFDISPRDAWHDDAALIACETWLKNHSRGICWTEHQFFARALSRRTGVPYYGAQGKTYVACGAIDAGSFIEDHPAGSPIIASIAANCTGRNLQYKWNENLITAPAADSERNEQLIARTHRPGQTEDTVTVDVLVGCREHLESIPRALASSDIKKDLLGFTQKLRIADICWPEVRGGRRGPRWA
jgi:hypothetical protein